MVPRSGSVGLVVGGQHLFMVLGYGYDMMKPAFGTKVFWGLLLDAAGAVCARFVLPKWAWTLSTLMSALWRRGTARQS